MKICMAGACGRMGRRIIELAAEQGVEVGAALDVAASVGKQITSSAGGDAVTVGDHAASEVVKADVLIDFTMAEGCLKNVAAAASASKAAVVGTTGLNEAQVEELRTLARQVAIVYAPNMSVGVNLLFKLTRQVAEVLGLDYNVEIVEIHHNLKKDSPSGTAVRLAERAAEGLGIVYPAQAVHGREGIVGERPRAEIGMHAVRGGDVVGDHTVIFAGQGERIELTHRAHSRDNFARGALRAAKFAATAGPGLYDMQDVLGLK